MSRNRFMTLSVLFDAIAFNVAVIAAFELRFALHVPAFNIAPYLSLWPYLTLVFLAARSQCGRAGSMWATLRVRSQFPRSRQ